MEIGSREIIVLAVVVLLLFGSRGIPHIAKSMKETMRQVRGAFKDDDTSPPVSKR